jgi:hypothetical protein
MKPFKLVQHESSFSVILTDADATPEVAAVFEEIGREPGGYAWGGLATHLIEDMDLDGVHLDCEAGMFCAYGPDQAPLLKLGERMAALFHNPDDLRVELDQSPESG